MKRRKRILLICLSVGVFAILAHFTWFEVTNWLATRKAAEDNARAHRAMSIQDWDDVAKKSDQRDRDYIAAHNGEPTVGGLRIGMTAQEAMSALPNGRVDPVYNDVCRWPHGSDGRSEILAKFKEGRLLTAKVVARGQDAFGLGTSVGPN